MAATSESGQPTYLKGNDSLVVTDLVLVLVHKLIHNCVETYTQRRQTPALPGNMPGLLTDYYLEYFNNPIALLWNGNLPTIFTDRVLIPNYIKMPVTLP